MHCPWTFPYLCQAPIVVMFSTNLFERSRLSEQKSCTATRKWCLYQGNCTHDIHICVRCNRFSAFSLQSSTRRYRSVPENLKVGCVEFLKVWVLGTVTTGDKKMEKFVCGKNKKVSSWYVRVGLTPAVVNVRQKGLRIISNKASPYAHRFSKLSESVLI